MVAARFWTLNTPRPYPSEHYKIMIVIKLTSVLAATPARPFSYKSKRGDMVSGFEADIQGVAVDGRMARVQIRGQTAADVEAKLSKFPAQKPAEIPVWGDLVANMYNVRAV